MSKLLEQVTVARLRGVPILAISSGDQIAVASALKGTVGEGSIIRWDSFQGLVPLNEAGKNVLRAFDPAALDASRASVEALNMMMEKLPDDGMLVMLNAHTALANAPSLASGVNVVRNKFKSSGRTLVLLGPGFRLPPELRGDIVEMEDPPPTDDAIAGIVKSVYEGASLGEPEESALLASMDATRGLLSAFSVEQAVALSMKPTGVDLPTLWERKRLAFKQIPGVTLTYGGPTWADIRGLAGLASHADRIARGPNPFGAVVLLDEMDKSLAGLGSRGGPGDSSGSTKAILEVILRYMEDYGWTGYLLVGVPGAGKTLFARCLAGSYQVPLVQLDLGALKGKYVGDTETNSRQAFTAVNGLAGKRWVCVVGTNNKIGVLPPELKRRFTLGTFYVRFPSEQEKLACQELYTKKYGLTAPQAASWPEVDTYNWTGAEVRNCADLAYKMGCSVKEAAEYIVPVWKSDAASVAELDRMADGCFLDASRPGTFRMAKVDETTRKVSLEA